MLPLLGRQCSCSAHKTLVCIFDYIIERSGLPECGGAVGGCPSNAEAQEAEEEAGSRSQQKQVALAHKHASQKEVQRLHDLALRTTQMQA